MIYLDSAATTFQKPAAVQRAVVRAMRTMSSPGRRVAARDFQRIAAAALGEAGMPRRSRPTSCCFAAAAQPRSSSPCRRASRSFSR